LHSAEILSTSSGGLNQHYEYAAYGGTRYTSSTTAFPITRRYASQFFDEETGLYYFGARYYDPVIGRFVQPDLVIPSLFNPQAYDRYGYCYDNPLKYFDPDGHAGYWADVGQVWLGYYDAGAGFVRGSVFAVAHPVTTVEGVGTAVLHLPTTVESIGNAVGQDWNSGLRGQGDVVGNALIVVGTALAPGAEASSASKIGQAVSTTSKAEQAGTAIQNAANTASKASAQEASTSATSSRTMAQVAQQAQGKAVMTQWGWQNSPAWRSAAKIIGNAGHKATVSAEDLGGKIPTESEARAMIESQGGTVIRAESGHPQGGISTHTYPHINYDTASGNSATVQIQALEVSGE
jgi:RHS repeat-associated protein